MKMTLIEIVRDILNDLDSDDVNGIHDTVESSQIAQIVRTCYYELLANRNWPHMRKLVQLEGSGTANKPNYLRLPERLKELSLVKYDIRKEDEQNATYADLKYLEPEEFLTRVSTKRDNTSVSEIVDFSGTRLYIVNNRSPQYWTSFDDTYLVTDSYNKEVDDALKKDKTQALAYIIPSWDATEDFVPDLPMDAFPLLLEEAKSTAFLTLKQMANQKAEQKVSRQQRWLSRKAWRAEGSVKFKDFGRKGRR